MKYVLGIDVGISSIGWSVLNLDKRRIEDLGVRCFSAAEVAKTKEPLAKARRDARLARRRLRRRRGRLDKIKSLFIKYGLLKPEELEEAFITLQNSLSPWELRVEGLDRILTGKELARALYHIAKHRGFKSNRKSDKSKEEGKLLEAVKQNQEKMQEYGFRTVGEMYLKDERFKDRKRNTTDVYIGVVAREALEDEIKAIFEAQRAYGNQFASADFEKKFLEAFLWQKSMLSGEELISKVGYCTFEKDEKRAPKFCWSAERFRLLNDINNLLRIEDNGTTRSLNDEERNKIIDAAYKYEKLTYSQVRKILNLPDSARFSANIYQTKKKRLKSGTETESINPLEGESKVFCSLKSYHDFKKIFQKNGVWEDIKNDSELLDTLGYAVTFYKNEDDLNEYLQSKKVPQAVLDSVSEMPDYSQVIHISIKALRKINPFLEKGLVYSEACNEAGYNHSDVDSGHDKKLKLPVIDIDDDAPKNPVVFRGLAQARKVVNAIVDKYGSPARVHIEFARDVGKSAEERNKIDRNIKETEAQRIREREEFKEQFGFEPRGDDLIKYRLYRDQNGQCAYSQKPLDLNRLFEPGYAEVDHVLPYSRSFDNSYRNRVLVLSHENQHKQNRTPFEWFGDDTERWAKYEAWVNATYKHDRKKANILLDKTFEKRQNDWFERNLSDTKYIARFFAGFIRRHLKLSDPSDQAPVMCFSGQVTALARGLWGLSKFREENDLHHAVDACVIAALTPGRIQAITKYHQANETGRIEKFIDPETGEIIENIGGKNFVFPEPWRHFRKEVLARLSDDPVSEIEKLQLESYKDNPPNIRRVFVSRMPIRKTSGEIHKETIRALRQVEGKPVSVIRKRLTELEEKDLKNLWDPESNKKLYEAIRQRMEEHNFDAKKAFETEFLKPSRDPDKAPIVRYVKVFESQPSGIEVRGGIADNGSMVRVDVFRDEKRFYLVPIYVSDFINGKLPNKAIKAHKPETEWTEMTENHKFLFSLYPYDLVYIKLKDREFLGYYRWADRSSAALCFSPHDDNKDKSLIKFGTKLAVSMEKYTIDVLGNISRVKKEKRVGLANCRRCKSSKIEGGE